MSTTHYEIAGVLLFDGPAKITRVIEVLFHPFTLNAAAAGCDSERRIATLLETPIPTWRNYVNRLTSLLPLEQQPDLAQFTEPAQFVEAIGRHFAVNTKAFADTIDFDSEMDIMDAVRLAKLLADGHNLVGVSLEGAWYSDSTRHPDFGGWGAHETPRCAIDLSSSDVVDFACSLDEALRNGASEAADVMGQLLSRFIDGIADPAIRETLKDRYVLPEKTITWPRPGDYDWSRTLYVGAIVTDDGEGPEWASIEVTPGFVRRLKKLRAACNMHRLDEVCVVNGPDLWGPLTDACHVPLASCRLVVTRDSFWFSGLPGRRACAFETLPLLIDWLLETFVGEGEPVFHKMDRHSVKNRAAVDVMPSGAISAL